MRALLKTPRCCLCILLIIATLPLASSRIADLGRLIETESNVSQLLLTKLFHRASRDTFPSRGNFAYCLDVFEARRLAQRYEAICGTAHIFKHKVLNDALTINILLRRLHKLWSAIAELLHCCCFDVARQIDRFRDDAHSPFPIETDVADSARTVMYLKDVYTLTITRLMQRNIDLQKELDMGELAVKASDIKDIGNVAFLKDDYRSALPWFLQSVKLAEFESETDDGGSFDVFDVIEVLPEMLLRQNNLEWAMHFAFVLRSLPGKCANASQKTRRQLRLFNNKIKILFNLERQEKAKKLIRFFERELQRLGRPAYAFGDPLPPLVNQRMQDSLGPQRDDYEALCRGEQIASVKRKPEILRCYLKNDSPFLSVAPLKAEQLSIDPTVTLFRNVISSEEIEAIKAAATPKLVPSSVVAQSAGNVLQEDARISESAWLSENDHPLLSQVTMRAEQMSGLDQSMVENQVAVYGLGGFYKPHDDFLSTKQLRMNRTQRLATVLLYLSGPPNEEEAGYENGGATVFPNLGLSVLPTKHDAIFWYNIRRNGQGDKRLLHAGCPLVSGTKWGRFLAELGQILKKDYLLRSPFLPKVLIAAGRAFKIV